MKTITLAMRGHLNKAVTSLATCWKIQRKDGRAFHFTDHDQDLVFGGNTYGASSSFSRSAITNSSNMAVDNLDVLGYFESDGMLENELRAGLFDRAEIWLFLVNWADLSMGQINLRRGWMGQTVLTKQGTYRAELRGLFQVLSQTVGEVYSFNCRADLGDKRCRVPLYPPQILRTAGVLVGEVYRVASAGTFNVNGRPVDAQGRLDSTRYGDRMYTVTTSGTTGSSASYSTNLGDTITDGTAQLRCDESWARVGVVTAFDATGLVTFLVNYTNGRDSRATIDAYYASGLVRWESGDNYPAAMEIFQSAVNANAVALRLPMPFPIKVGDRCVITPGCQRTPQMCSGRYGNILNYRGEPFVPGLDALVQTGNAG
jgi:hypothetical protein